MISTKSGMSAPLLNSSGFDLFLNFRKKVEIDFEKLKVNFEAWLRSSSGTSADDLLKRINGMLSSLKKSKKSVLQMKPADVPQAQIDECRNFLSTHGKALASMKHAIQNKVKADEQKKNRNMLISRSDVQRPPGPHTMSPNPSGPDHSQFLRQHEEEKADAHMDDIGVLIEDITDITKTHINELVVHDKMLGELEEGMEEAESRFDVVMQKVTKLLGTKDRYEMTLIIVMFIIIIALLFLVM
eukprot:TRINITY_DN5835_c0_g1_i1.p1 TRINITY_DN5835_c0_g1~~TRINITY_DN5835_c0_g1_i1.p1  ORF type:complete len:242 (-),score=57.86 TRINITY_DN5835_c0_g1_i1:165-890(-)